MEIRYVQAFLAICEELHFGRAAARLHVAQPTLSDHLQRLERSVGARLIDRGSRGVVLTEAGRAFEPRARRGLAELAAAAQSANEAATGATGSLRIGFNYPAGTRVLPSALRRLRALHPRLRFTLTELRSGQQLAEIAGGRLDVGFVFGPPSDDRFAYRQILRTPLVALVGRGHPLAGRPAVSYAELAEHPCILFERRLSPAAHDALVNGARQGGVELDVVDEINDSMATAVLVASGGVVGFSSQFRGEDAVAQGLHPVGITGPEPTVDIGAAWPQASQAPQVKGLLDSLEYPVTKRPAADKGAAPGRAP